MWYIIIHSACNNGSILPYCVRISRMILATNTWDVTCWFLEFRWNLSWHVWFQKYCCACFVAIDVYFMFYDYYIVCLLTIETLSLVVLSLSIMLHSRAKWRAIYPIRGRIMFLQGGCMGMYIPQCNTVWIFFVILLYMANQLGISRVGQPEV